MNASFIHGGGPGMASYRYRAAIPARELGASLNDRSAGALVFAKPTKEEYEFAVQSASKWLIADFCDDHFDRFSHYGEFARLADAVSCPTAEMAKVIKAWTGLTATVIPDPYEFEERPPHCNGDRLLWFGHSTNFGSLARVLQRLNDYELTIVSNFPGAMPWSLETMAEQFAVADIVILPATEPYKSPNRALEAIRQGCFVVAEPHPSLVGIEGIWIGDIPEGIEWARENPLEANEWTRQAQQKIRDVYSPRTLAFAWRNLLNPAKSASTSAVAKSTGTDG